MKTGPRNKLVHVTVSVNNKVKMEELRIFPNRLWARAPNNW